MNKRLLILTLTILLIASLLILPAVFTKQNAAPIQSRLVLAAGDGEAYTDLQAFERATGPRILTFPADHGPHPDYQTEWWYYTGNVVSEDGQRFGYQLTFFRRALLPPTQRVDRPSAWATDQVYMAHFAITNVAANRYQAYERLSRGSAGLAGAQADPFQVWLEDWSVRQTGPDIYQLSASQAGNSIELQLVDRKGPILQGDAGYSQKGPQPGNASYYYSQTRLESQGRVRIGGDTYPVHGSSWMDHEFSTSALSNGQIGWDWFSIQLNDNSELMVFQIRRQDGSVDPFSSGAWIDPKGNVTRLSKEDFNLQVNNSWLSPNSGSVYPAGWALSVPKINMDLDIQPFFADQELNVSYSYWEGAIQISGSRNGFPVSGSGYAELTGYSGSMSGEF